MSGGGSTSDSGPGGASGRVAPDGQRRAASGSAASLRTMPSAVRHSCKPASMTFGIMSNQRQVSPRTPFVAVEVDRIASPALSPLPSGATAATCSSGSRCRPVLGRTSIVSVELARLVVAPATAAHAIGAVFVGQSPRVVPPHGARDPGRQRCTVLRSGSSMVSIVAGRSGGVWWSARTTHSRIFRSSASTGGRTSARRHRAPLDPRRRRLTRSHPWSRRSARQSSMSVLGHAAQQGLAGRRAHASRSRRDRSRRGRSASRPS